MNFQQEAQGETHAVLAKAVASAAAAGLACQTLSRTSDRPAEAIVQAAKARHCDLIVMASRGRQAGLAGWLHTSQTERVLRESPVALLVTRVGLNDPPTAAERALAVILDEHRSIAAVLRGMLALVVQQPAPDLAVLRAVLAWLQAFPLQMHHPTEEQYLHHRLRQRTPAAEALLMQLEERHRDEHQHVAQMLACLQSLQAGDSAAVVALTTYIDALADAVWQHLGLEERELLPSDWDEMALAFEGHEEPAFGDLPAGEFRKLFPRIANLLPAARGG